MNDDRNSDIEPEDVEDSDGSDLDEKIVDRCIANLMERFDGCQIFVFRDKVEGGEKVSSNYKSGAGNWYARMEIVREWIMDRDETSRAYARQQVRRTNPDVETDRDGY